MAAPLSNPPTRRYREHPLHFIQRVCNWLSEPDRRRLGHAMSEEVQSAALELSIGTVFAEHVFQLSEDTVIYFMSDGSVRWK